MRGRVRLTNYRQSQRISYSPSERQSRNYPTDRKVFRRMGRGGKTANARAPAGLLLGWIDHVDVDAGNLDVDPAALANRFGGRVRVPTARRERGGDQHREQGEQTHGGILRPRPAG